MQTRTEQDTFGTIEVPDYHYWGAQTQRSLDFFAISTETMPEELIQALAEVKRACAIVNHALGLLPDHYCLAIVSAADELLAGKFPDEFPLSVWQTGSGTQTNMNMNEVLANRASEILGGQRGLSRLVHANDHVNLGQSSNDVFPSAIHLVVSNGIIKRLLPAIHDLQLTLQKKSDDYQHLVKVGRTHLQDATPITLGQEISGYISQLEITKNAIEHTLPALQQLAIGGSAVGTGVNTHPEFGKRVADELGQRLGIKFTSAVNKFSALAGHEALLISHSALKSLATALVKIANDMRWLASGPRCGLGEIALPENEPGSSIMPGKVNPTQPEALIMVCYQVCGNDAAMTAANASGNFELNVCKPLMAYVHSQSIRLLTDGINSFHHYCVKGLVANATHISKLVHSSLMLVTALVPYIGYDKAAQIARLAHHQNISLRDAALHSGYVTEAQFDHWVDILAMTRSAS